MFYFPGKYFDFRNFLFLIVVFLGTGVQRNIIRAALFLSEAQLVFDKFEGVNSVSFFSNIAMASKFSHILLAANQIRLCEII